MLLISALIWVVIVLLFRNSYTDYQWEDGYRYEKKVWLEEDRLTAPLWLYILVAISIFIPVLNVIIAPSVLIALIIGYSVGEIYLHIELPEQLKFLIEEY